MDVKHKLWILDDIHPETQREAGKRGQKQNTADSKWGTPGGGAAAEVHRSPVALPSVTHVGVMDPVSVRLLIQEVKHVFDGEGQSASAVDRAEQRLEEVVDKFLQRSLENQEAEVKHFKQRLALALKLHNLKC